MTLHLKSRGYPFRPRLLFSCFIVVGVGFPNCVLFQERTTTRYTVNVSIHAPRVGCDSSTVSGCVASSSFQFTHPVWGAT